MTTKADPAAVPGPVGDPGAAAARCPRTILRQARDLADVLRPGQLGRHRRADRPGRARPRARRQRLAGQGRDPAEGGAGAGTADDRNVILLIDWPRP